MATFKIAWTSFEFRWVFAVWRGTIAAEADGSLFVGALEQDLVRRIGTDPTVGFNRLLVGMGLCALGFGLLIAVPPQGGFRGAFRAANT